MHKIHYLSLLLWWGLMLCACSTKGVKHDVDAENASSAEQKGTAEDSAMLIQPRCAQGFTVKYLADGVRLVEVCDPQKEEERMPVGYAFALVPRGSKTAVPEGYERVEVPIRSTITMTSLQLSNFTALRAHDIIKGITGTKNLYNEDILQRVRDGRIQKIGMEGNFDTELILAANPDVIFISPFKRGGYDTIKETGITLIPHLGYKELSPLGQAEWIKFVALFIGKEAEANEAFAGIEQRYNALKSRVDSLLSSKPHNLKTSKPHNLITSKPQNLKTSKPQNLKTSKPHNLKTSKPHNLKTSKPHNLITSKPQNLKTSLPTVFSGEMHGGNWYAVGGRNHLAQLFRDAGADYIIHDDNTGGVNLEYEQLYATAAHADYWRILNSFKGDFSYEALRASEPRNALFKAFKERHVIYCNMRQTPYYESAPVQPDQVLADLVAIFHPELLPDHEGKYYQLLKE